MRKIVLLVLLVSAVNTVPAAAIDAETAYRDMLADLFKMELIDIQPKIYEPLNPQERDVANQVDLEFDRTDLGVAPEATIKNGHRVIHFPMGFVFVLAVFCRSVSESVLDERFLSNLARWLYSLDDAVMRMRSDRNPTLDTYNEINKIPSICNMILKDEQYCRSFLYDKQSPLYDTFHDNYRAVADAATIMIAGQELSHHLLGHAQGDANQNMAESDKEKAADQKGAEVYVAARQDPVIAASAFFLSVIVKDPRIGPRRLIRDRSTVCRTMAVSRTVFSNYLNSRKGAEFLQSKGILNRIKQYYDDNLDKKILGCDV